MVFKVSKILVFVLVLCVCSELCSNIMKVFSCFTCYLCCVQNQTDTPRIVILSKHDGALQQTEVRVYDLLHNFSLR